MPSEKAVLLSLLVQKKGLIEAVELSSWVLNTQWPSLLGAPQCPQTGHAKASNSLHRTPRHVGLSWFFFFCHYLTGSPSHSNSSHSSFSPRKSDLDHFIEENTQKVNVGFSGWNHICDGSQKMAPPTLGTEVGGSCTVSQGRPVCLAVKPTSKQCPRLCPGIK